MTDLLLVFLPMAIGLLGMGVMRGMGVEHPKPMIFGLVVGVVGSLGFGYVKTGQWAAGLCPALVAFLIVSVGMRRR